MMHHLFFIALFAILSSRTRGSLTTLTASDYGLLVNARLDPLISPGQCSDHVHSVFGNSKFGPTLEAEVLQDDDWRNITGKDNQTTSEIIPNLSSYWAPSLYIWDEESQLYHLTPSYARIYYRVFHRPNDLNKSFINPFPRNLQFRMGDPHRKQAWQPDETSNRDNIRWTLRTWNRQLTRWWSHGDWSYLKEDASLVNASLEDIELNINFPDCLQVDENTGQPVTTSANFRDHGSYKSSQWNPSHGNYCPDDFPFQIPRLNMEVRYKLNPMRQKLGDEVTHDVNNWILSTGDNSGASGHGDFVSGWPLEMMREMIDGCRNSRSIDRATNRICILEDYNLDGRLQKTVPFSNPIPDEEILAVAQLPSGSCPPMTSTIALTSSPPTILPSPNPTTPYPTDSPTYHPSKSPSIYPTMFVSWTRIPDDHITRVYVENSSTIHAPTWCAKGGYCMEIQGPVGFVNAGISVTDAACVCATTIALTVKVEFDFKIRNSVFEESITSQHQQEGWSQPSDFHVEAWRYSLELPSFFQWLTPVSGGRYRYGIDYGADSSLSRHNVFQHNIFHGVTIFSLPAHSQLYLRFLFLAASDGQRIYVDNLTISYIDE